MSLSRDDLEALPFGQQFTVTSACPSCSRRGNVTVTVKLIAKRMGTFSLSGNGIKFPAHRGYWAECEACGWAGEAGPKDGENDTRRDPHDRGSPRH